VLVAAAERQEHIEERHLASLQAEGHAKVEPVGAASHLIGRHGNPQRVASLAVVSRLTGYLDDDARLVCQQRQQFCGEAHGVQTGQARTRRQDQLRAGGHLSACLDQAEPGKRHFDAGQDGLLGGWIPVPAVFAGRIKCRAQG
jgi:hypothetical protein